MTKEETTWTPAVGDTVYLTSGSCKMTIETAPYAKTPEDIGLNGLWVSVVWMVYGDNTRVIRDAFRVESLRRA